MLTASGRRERITGSDNIAIEVEVAESEISLRYCLPHPREHPLTIFLAFGTHQEIGAAVLPFQQNEEGSTVFLPFKADLFLSAQTTEHGLVAFIRRWHLWRWSERERTDSFQVSEVNGDVIFRIPRTLLGRTEAIDFVVYAKDRS